jgi:hypothetical protein
MTSWQSPPQPLPEALWGNSWRFASLLAGDLLEQIGDRPIPFQSLPEELSPLSLGLASSLPIPGIIIYGDRQSLPLARWLAEVDLVFLNYIPAQVGESGGIVLHTSSGERWILLTFTDEEVAQAAENFSQRQAQAQGLHFLLVQPDDSGVTYTGFWLLQNV